MDSERIYKYVAEKWDSTIIPTLCEYIRIPNQSPGTNFTRFFDSVPFFSCCLYLVLAFDKEWATNGHMDKAVQLMVDWVHGQSVPGLELEVRFRCRIFPTCNFYLYTLFSHHRAPTIECKPDLGS